MRSSTGRPASRARPASASTRASPGGVGARGVAEPGELGERLAADRLDQLGALDGALGVALGDPVGRAGLDRDDADVVGDRVVELARNAHPLGRRGGDGLAHADALDLRRLLPHLPGQLPLAAHDATDRPRDGHAAQQRRHDPLGIEDGGVRRRGGRGQGERAERRAALAVRPDRVGRADDRDDVGEGDGVEVEQQALQRDGAEHGGGRRHRPAAAPQEGKGDRHGGERRRDARVDDRELDLGGDEHRGREHPVRARAAERARVGRPARGSRLLVALAQRRASGVRHRAGPDAAGPRVERGERVRRRQRRRLALAPEHAEHAPHVRERVAGGAGDARELRLRRGVLPGAQGPGQQPRPAHDRAQAVRHRRLEVRGDAGALLVRGVPRGLRALAQQPLGLRLELALQHRLAAHPATDEQGARHRHDGQDRVGGTLDRRVEHDARRGGGGDRGRGAGEGMRAADMAAGAVEGQDERRDRRDRVADQEPVERPPARGARRRSRRAAPAAPGAATRAARS